MNDLLLKTINEEFEMSCGPTEIFLNESERSKWSFGFLDFYFPDPGRQHGRWTEKRIPPPMSDIPLYREPDGEIFDKLHFGMEQFTFPQDSQQQSYPVRKQKNNHSAIDDGTYFVVSTVNGSSLQPYMLRHGRESAIIHAENKEDEIRCKDDLNFYKTLLYRLWFRTYGEWEKGWYHIVLDETTGSRAYIRKENERIRFVSWEEEFCEGKEKVTFLGHKLFEEHYWWGKEIEIADSEKSDHSISLISGSWMCVGEGEEYNSKEERWISKRGWLRWRDNNGILPGIKTYTPIY